MPSRAEPVSLQCSTAPPRHRRSVRRVIVSCCPPPLMPTAAFHCRLVWHQWLAERKCAPAAASAAVGRRRRRRHSIDGPARLRRRTARRRWLTRATTPSMRRRRGTRRHPRPDRAAMVHPARRSRATSTARPDREPYTQGKETKGPGDERNGHREFRQPNWWTDPATTMEKMNADLDAKRVTMIDTVDGWGVESTSGRAGSSPASKTSINGC